ncbi:MAG: hypothetical protein WCA08_21325 [Desulfoferrobacter sp.]
MRLVIPASEPESSVLKVFWTPASAGVTTVKELALVHGNEQCYPVNLVNPVQDFFRQDEQDRQDKETSA